MRRRALVVLAGLLAVAPPLAAQRADSLVTSGIRSYQDLEFDAAAGFLSRALQLLDESPDSALRATVLAYLGATEVYRGGADSAQGVFRRLVRMNPAYRLDRLLFPPEVTSVFDAARRATPAVGGHFPAESRFQAGTPAFATTLLGSTFHQIRVEVQRPDASVVLSLYAGLIGDSLPVEWDGRIGPDEAVATGRYLLSVTSLDPTGAVARILRVPLDITNFGVDTIPTPALPEADLLPELQPAASGRNALLGGLLVGLTTVAAPSVVASDASLSASRFAVGGVVVAIGVAAFIMSRDERPVPENIAVNDSIRTAWRQQVDAAVAENVRRRATAEILIRVGAAQVIEQEER